MAVYCVVQAIQDLFLTPKIMGKAMGLNPAIILLSLSIWGTLLGFLGLIIALPLTTLLLAYYDEYLNTLPIDDICVRDIIMTCRRPTGMMASRRTMTIDILNRDINGTQSENLLKIRV